MKEPRERLVARVLAIGAFMEGYVWGANITKRARRMTRVLRESEYERHFTQGFKRGRGAAEAARERYTAELQAAAWSPEKGFERNG